MRAQDRTELKPYEKKRLPKKPEHTPENSEAVRMCVNAWHELEGDRHSGFGFAPIPFAALVVWAEANQLDRDSFDLLRHVIRQLDNDRAAREENKRKHDAKKGKKR